MKYVLLGYWQKINPENKRQNQIFPQTYWPLAHNVKRLVINNISVWGDEHKCARHAR